MKKVKILALVSALLTAVFAYFFLNSLKKPTEVQKITVLVAASDIASNTQITKDMVTLISIPVEAAHPDSVINLSSALGFIVKSDIKAGEQILRSKLVAAGDSSSLTLAYSVSPGMRAITVAVDEVSGLSGMLKPGNKIDIIALFKVEEQYINANGSTGTKSVVYTKLLLENKLILAVDSSLDINGKAAKSDGTVSSYTSITLQVTPEEAMETSFSEFTGKLRAVLRSPLDGGTADLPNMTLEDVLSN